MSLQSSSKSNGWLNVSNFTRQRIPDRRSGMGKWAMSYIWNISTIMMCDPYNTRTSGWAIGASQYPDLYTSGWTIGVSQYPDFYTSRWAISASQYPDLCTCSLATLRCNLAAQRLNKNLENLKFVRRFNMLHCSSWSDDFKMLHFFSSAATYFRSFRSSFILLSSGLRLGQNTCPWTFFSVKRLVIYPKSVKSPITFCWNSRWNTSTTLLIVSTVKGLESCILYMVVCYCPKN